MKERPRMPFYAAFLSTEKIFLPTFFSFEKPVDILRRGGIIALKTNPLRSKNNEKKQYFT